KPIAGVSARTPAFSSADTTLRATSLTRSPAWWNSRLATERAGLRIGSRFIRQTKLRSVLAGGKARRMSARWSSRAGRLISTRPASSAPQSRHSWRSRAASSGFGGSAGPGRSPWLSWKRRTVGCSARFMTALSLYVQVSAEKNTGPSPLGLGPPQLLRRPVEQGDPLVPQEFAGPALRLLPGRHRLLDQALPLGR